MRRSSAGRLFHTDSPETENARRPNEVRVRTVMAALPGSAAVKLIRQEEEQEQKETDIKSVG